MKLLDTTVAIDHLRGLPAAVDLFSTVIRADERVMASEVVRFELLAGVRANEVAALERFFMSVTWVPVAEDIARTAGALARKYRRAHSGIDDSDYLIAGTAIVLDVELLTTNVRHFPMFAGLAPPY